MMAIIDDGVSGFSMHGSAFSASSASSQQCVGGVGLVAVVGGCSEEDDDRC